MSSSNKKKLRKEQEAALLTEKQLAEKKEAKKLKNMTVIFAVVMILVACIAIGTIAYTNIYKTGIFQKNSVAATTNGHELSSVDLGYYYVDAISNNYSNWYNTYGDYTISMLQMMGLDLTAPLNAQIYDDTTGETWSDYFISVAIENARGTYALYDAAVAEGYVLPEADRASLDENTQIMIEYADLFAAGDIDAYIENIYGIGSDLESYKKYVDVVGTANSYQATYYNNLTYDDAAIREYEADRYKDFNGYSFTYKFIDQNEFLGEGTKDEEGNVTYTDAEIAAAQDEAKKTAESLVSATSVEKFDEMISALEIYAPAEGEAATVSTKVSDALLPTVLSALQEWVSADERKEGDIGVLPYTTEATDENGSVTSTLMGYIAVYFQSVDEHLEPLANVRHLLVQFEGGTTDENGNKVYSVNEKATAKVEAEELLKTWKDGTATEESFIELVKKHSDDSSAEDGGLFENISPASRYVENFLNWSIDPDRETGDVDLIETEYGYHIMYYVGDSDIIYRDQLIREDMKANDYDAWIAEKEDGVTAEAGNTKYMYHDYIAYSGASY